MAMIIKLETRHGLTKPLYWRLNNFDQLGNREPDGSRVPAVARFRAYVSEVAFRAGKSFIDEMTVSFVPTWEGDPRAEAYAALKAQDPSVEAKASVSQIGSVAAAAAAQDTELSRHLKDLNAKLPDTEKEKTAHLRNLGEAEAALAQLTAHRDRIKQQMDIAMANLAAATAFRKAIVAAKDA